MTTVETHSIPLPEGYTIIERLGAGGYGEVWKATAPGGVEKAVKVVYGHCEEGMAEREQKALERVKSVRHPFILSIERYEIVDSRLVIVTELAEMSLQDEFLKYQAEGQLGIPRARLLDYLWDAAEALDYMVERHSLQHLDIKPENLLVLGDHTKVADFGLVKQLATRTLNSMMGGITPLYSAPEIFDDNPSSKSDQYSLAIVYQHLLTDSLPFPGRTPAQLAKQHTLATPNLRPLSEADRQIVARALAKDPAERFANCREFVSALKSADPNSSIPGHYVLDESVGVASKPPAQSDTLQVAELDTEAIEAPLSNAATQVLSTDSVPASEPIEPEPQAPARSPFPAVDPKVTEIACPNVSLQVAVEAVSTLFVGVGGLGIRMLRTLHANADQTDLAQETPKAWLAIDTDRESLNGDRSQATPDPIAHEDKLHIPLRRPKQYRDSSQNLLRWVSRRWLYNIPRSLQTRGFRPLGRIAAVDHAEQVLSAIQSRLAWLTQQQNGSSTNQTVRVVILAGMSGGTGSGTLIDLAQGVRSLCQGGSLEVIVQAVLGSTYELGSGDSLAAANMFSLLTELTHSQSLGNCGECRPTGAPSLFESSNRPFDDLYMIEMPKQGSLDCQAKLQSIANYLLLNSDKRISGQLDKIQPSLQHPSEDFSLSTFDCVELESLSAKLNQTKRESLIDAITEYWVQESSLDVGNIGGFFGQHAASKFTQLVHERYQPIPRVVDESRVAEVGEDDKEYVKANQTRNAAVKQIAFAFSEHLQNHSPKSTGTLDSHAEDLCKRIVDEFVDIVREEQLSEAELGQRFSAILMRNLDDTLQSARGVGADQLARAALGQASSGPLECGYQRQSILLIPQNQEDAELLTALRQECETTASCQTELVQKFLVRSGRGLKPLELGARLTETFPDIDEAAGRLQTRNDINWRDLRDAAFSTSTH